MEMIMNSFIDLNAADRQHGLLIIPPGVYCLRIKLKTSGSSKEVLRWAKSMRTQHLELEYIVVDGAHTDHRITDYITVKFDDGQHAHLPALSDEQIRKYETAVRLGLRKLRAIIESALAIDPADNSEGAKRKREIADFRVFDGLTFYGQVEVRKGSNEFRDRNILDYVITPDLPDYPNRPTKSAPKRSLASELDDELPY
jgi:hypothetical protein